jgi:hypothetical protein
MMRKVITATEGYILTDGEIYGTEIYLADGVDGEAFYEITLEEYNAMLESGEATDADYRSALKEMGVNV